ncbi:MAG: hypothetical protein RLQ25_02740 [Alphaproteobacteria bacterium]
MIAAIPRPSILRAAALALAGLLLAACYETSAEIIPPDQAISLTDLPGSYSGSDGAETEIAAIAFSNDYRFRRVTADNEQTVGTIRIMPLTGDIYVVQMADDDDSAYTILFYRFSSDQNGTGFSRVTPAATDEQLVALAASHGATYDPDFAVLEGPAATQLAFVLAHAELPFTTADE